MQSQEINVFRTVISLHLRRCLTKQRWSIKISNFKKKDIGPKRKKHHHTGVSLQTQSQKVEPQDRPKRAARKMQL